MNEKIEFLEELCNVASAEELSFFFHKQGIPGKNQTKLDLMMEYCEGSNTFEIDMNAYTIQAQREFKKAEEVFMTDKQLLALVKENSDFPKDLLDYHEHSLKRSTKNYDTWTKKIVILKDLNSRIPESLLNNKVLDELQCER